ncbi:MAG: hypothetical protein GY851_01290, partial [bacterium]|nr:hypothetical protein [bacterium]
MKRIAVLLALAALPALAAPGPIDVGNEKQLFIDDLFFQTASNVTLRVHPPIKTNEKTLEREMPWEGVTLNWFTVLEDPRGAVTEGARYRMWYECY